MTVTLLEQIALDRELFFDDSGAGLAESVTIDGVAGVGIYEAPAFVSGGDFEGVAPALRVWASDWTGLAQDATVVLRGITFKVASVQAGTYGMTMLQLRR